jgi:hypothetical protein
MFTSRPGLDGAAPPRAGSRMDPGAVGFCAKLWLGGSTGTLPSPPLVKFVLVE